MAPPFNPTHPAQAVDAMTWGRIGTLNPSAVSDILHARGLHDQVMRHDIQALDPAMRLRGIARTMASRPLVDAPAPGREYELLFAAIDGLRAGEVLVTDETDCCVWGELCAEAAMRRGGNGVVIGRRLARPEMLMAPATSPRPSKIGAATQWAPTSFSSMSSA